MSLRIKVSSRPACQAPIIFCGMMIALTYCTAAVAEKVWRIAQPGDRYPAQWRQGIAQKDHEVIAGKLKVAGWVSVYIGMRTVTTTYNETWEEDAFTSERKANSLLAGCTGDFNGDDAKDYLLVLKRVENRDHQMYAFIAERKHYRVIPMYEEPFQPRDISDHTTSNEAYGPSVPECGKKPKSGIFQPLGDEGESYPVKGDVITFGWYSYFWGEDGFNSALSSD